MILLKDELEQYYFLHNQLGWVRCENCNQSVKAARVSNAHILPKGIFKSVSTNIHNHMYLCFSCHSQFDSNWEIAYSMFVFKKAKERYEKFKQYVTETSHPVLQYFK